MSQDPILVSVDATSLYTNILQEEGIEEAVQSMRKVPQ